MTQHIFLPSDINSWSSVFSSFCVDRQTDWHANRHK